MNESAAHDIRRILNVVLALEAAFKAQTQHPTKPAATRKPSKPTPIKVIKPIKPVGPQPNKPV
jgi:hypothetical protein